VGASNKHRIIREELFEVRHLQPRILFGFGNPPLNGEVLTVSQMDPRSYIGFMVNLRNYQFRSWWKLEGKGKVPE